MCTDGGVRGVLTSTCGAVREGVHGCVYTWRGVPGVYMQGCTRPVFGFPAVSAVSAVSWLFRRFCCFLTFLTRPGSWLVLAPVLTRPGSWLVLLLTLLTLLTLTAFDAFDRKDTTFMEPKSVVA